MMGMVTTGAPAAVYQAGPPVDRHAGEGPPPCCAKGRVGADKLVWYGGIAPDAMARVRAALPQLEGVADEDVYLCDGCRWLIEAARVLSPDEMPRAWPVEGDDVTG